MNINANMDTYKNRLLKGEQTTHYIALLLWLCVKNEMYFSTIQLYKLYILIYK